MLHPIHYRLKLFFSHSDTQLERVYEESYARIIPRLFKTFLLLVTSGQWGSLLREFNHIDNYVNCFDQWLTAIEVDRCPEAYILLRTIAQPSDFIVYNGSNHVQKPIWMHDFTHNNYPYHVTAIHFIFNVIYRFCEHYDFKWWCINKYDMIRHIVHLQKTYCLNVPQVMDERFPQTYDQNEGIVPNVLLHQDVNQQQQHQQEDDDDDSSDN